MQTSWLYASVGRNSSDSYRRQNMKSLTLFPLQRTGRFFSGQNQKGASGVESCGMMCSEEELVWQKKACDGLMILPKDTPIGMDIHDYWS